MESLSGSPGNGSGSEPAGETPSARLDGTQLAAISNALVGLHRRYFGRGATKAKCYQVNDDLILVELRDAYLTVERTLIERGQVNTVRQTRLTFQQAMFQEFIEAVEHVAGRQVCSYASETITSPEAVLEIFYLEPAGNIGERLSREADEDSGRVERPTGGVPGPV